MNKKKLIFLISILVVVIIAFATYFIVLNNNKMPKETKKYEEVVSKNEIVSKEIKFEEKSKKIMKDYLDDYQKIQKNNNKKNVLVVTSKEKIKENYGATEIVEAPNNQYFLQYNTKKEKENALKKFSKDNNIKCAEENIVYKIVDNEIKITKENIEKAKSKTNSYNSWGITAMGLEEAANNLKTQNETVVAIIDTGCDIELLNKNYSGKIKEVYNILDTNAQMEDTDGHGTHIAGTIAEGTPDNIKILPVKVAISGKEIYNTDIIMAINYITENKKADVINLSLGSYVNSTSIQDAIQAANSKNIICVAAAGNDNTSKEHYPSAYKETISIAACDMYLNKANFSNYGDTIDFIAPGKEILSINGTLNGTSMATPHVACAVAMLKNSNSSYNLAQIKDKLKEYTIDLGDEGWDQYNGWGFIKFDEVPSCVCDCGNCNGIICPCSDKMEVAGEVSLTAYNYGSITNLNPIKLKISKGFKVDRVSFLDIVGNGKNEYWNINYDPYKNDVQSIEVSYENLNLVLHINPIENYQSAWQYEILEDNSIKLTGMKDEENVIGSLFLPENIDNHTVTQIDFRMSEKIKKDLKRIVINDSLKRIGSYVFYNCSNVETLTQFGHNNEKLVLEDYAFKRMY